MVIGACTDAAAMLGIINLAAEAYRGVIPDDCWHEPYMPAAELGAEMAAGVAFVGCEIDGVLAGVMGMQRVRNVSLIRHAYVLPDLQGRGIGAALLAWLRAGCSQQLLVGTWAAARWAVGFYERQGFAVVDDESAAALLRAHWTVSARQVETSVVLADPWLSAGDVKRVIAEADGV